MTVKVPVALVATSQRGSIEAALGHEAVDYDPAHGPADIGSNGVVVTDGQAGGGAHTVLVGDAGRGDEPAAIRRAFRAGAAGYVRLDEVATALVPTILAVAAGQSALPAERREDALPPSLTGRERQVLSLVVMGLSNAEIGERLFVAESTIKSHLSSAFAKLGVGSRNEAVARILDPRTGLGVGILTIPRDGG